MPSSGKGSAMGAGDAGFARRHFTTPVGMITLLGGAVVMPSAAGVKIGPEVTRCRQ